MRVFITAAGMVGCHAARELLDRGDEVAFFDLAPRADFIQRVVGADVPVTRGDVRELPGVLEAVQAFRPDVVIHTAGLIGSVAQQLPYRGFEINVLGTINVMEATRLAGVRRFIQASTLGVVDRSAPQLAPITEEFQLGGNDSVYGTSKVASEQILRAYAKHYRIELAMLRFAGVYGYGHFAGGSGVGRATWDLVTAAIAGQPGVIGSGIPETNVMVYIKDLARGVAQAVHAEQLPHHTYNLGQGVIVTPSEVVTAIQKVFPGFTAARPAGAGSGKGGAPILQPFDISRARSELGYEIRYDLGAGIADMIAEVRRP
jgi:nucleoside-diphosphate-sugar epimerase